MSADTVSMTGWGRTAPTTALRPAPGARPAHGTRPPSRRAASAGWGLVRVGPFPARRAPGV
ncbi:hypothetical protein [Streptomyces sp. NPDC059166]|uniref:hypothetical protein n=1 Tax=Streptomyces sp. NPDC059166 TaxID=3346752 RepID=UPI0036BCDEC2